VRGFPSSNSEEECDQTIDIDLKGVWLSLKCEILHILKQGGGGTIVNMASLTGLVGATGGSSV
jgi:NAD(P)-dependent dehydrogenase (short-subunit alcohol dehydrogenase family)